MGKVIFPGDRKYFFSSFAGFSTLTIVLLVLGGPWLPVSLGALLSIWALVVLVVGPSLVVERTDDERWQVWRRPSLRRPPPGRPVAVHLEYLAEHPVIVIVFEEGRVFRYRYGFASDSAPEVRSQLAELFGVD